MLLFPVIFGRPLKTSASSQYSIPFPPTPCHPLYLQLQIKGLTFKLCLIHINNFYVNPFSFFLKKNGQQKERVEPD